jgi:hypothetical protein
MTKEAWWVCTCGALINRVGKPTHRIWDDHLKVCKLMPRKPGGPSIGMSIEQLDQQEVKRRRP